MFKDKNTSFKRHWKSKLRTSGTLFYLPFVKHHKVAFQGREGMIYICKAFADLFQTDFAHPDDLCSNLPRSFKLVFQVQRWELPGYNFWITLNSLLQDVQYVGCAPTSSYSLCLKGEITYFPNYIIIKTHFASNDAIFASNLKASSFSCKKSKNKLCFKWYLFSGYHQLTIILKNKCPKLNFIKFDSYW